MTGRAPRGLGVGDVDEQRARVPAFDPRGRSRRSDLWTRAP